MTNSQRLLIIGFVWPEPNSSAAGSRMMQLIALFQEQNWEITFASTAADSEFMFDVTSIGIEKVAIKLNDSSFDNFVKNLNPTMVLFDRFMVEEQFGWRVAEQCPEAIRILDTEDLHCLRKARQKTFKLNTEFSKNDLFSDIAKREIASILRCDISLIISEIEMNLLQEEFKIDKNLLYYLPFLVPPLIDTQIKTWPKFEDRKDFIFIGNFLHEPNWNTVQYLKETIWPLIHKELPEASMLVYGAYPSEKVFQLHNSKQQFLVLGRTENAEDVVKKARVVLAPIRFGAGVKGKLLEAMQCGTPSVTTSIGAEGMLKNLPWNGIISDNPQELANAAIKLYQDENLWKKSQLNGIEIINQQYSKHLFDNNFILHLLNLQTTIKNHRNLNFIGSVLMHHTMASTKYMSRWIEAKNSK